MTRHSDQDGLRDREEREQGEVEALGRMRKQAGRVDGMQAGAPTTGNVLYNKCRMLRTATLSELCSMCSLKTLSFLTRLCLDIHTSTSKIHFIPAVFVLGLT